MLEKAANMTGCYGENENRAGVQENIDTYYTY